MDVVDPSSLQAKYAAEAQKRLRSDGLDQYQEIQKSDSARVRRLGADAWADHAALDAQLEAAPPLRDGDRVKFLISGAGINGILMAVRLVLAGFPADQIRLVDMAGGVGGTWYWNRYPGLHCDIESYVYMPLLEEMGYMPSQKYAPGIEIREYLNSVVKKYKLDDKVLFRTKFERLEWDDEKSIWKADLATTRGPSGSQGDGATSQLSVEAEFAFLTAGYLARPHVPKLDGQASLDVFEGDMFHTAMWDYNVTGGSDKEVFPALDKLKGKRVGVLGTGGTAVQVVPQLAEHAGEVYVFQRTPSAVFTRGQRDTDADEYKTKVANAPGWHKRRMENMAAWMSGVPGTPNLIDDEWANQPAFSALVCGPDWAHATPDQVPQIIAHYMALDADNRARMRRRIAEKVVDGPTAERLTPWYPVWCKRPCFSDTYLEAFNRPNVHLVDTEGRGVGGATPRGLKVGAAEYELDVLVLATGYTSPVVGGGDPSVRTGIEIVGRGGRSMPAKWEEKGMATLHGLASNGFPNLFWFGASQGATAANIQFIYDAQSRHIAKVVAAGHEKMAHAAEEGGSGGGSSEDAHAHPRLILEVEQDAEEAWSMRIMQGATRLAVMSVCTPGYLTSEGEGLRMMQGQVKQPSQEDMMKQARAAPFSAGAMAYFEELEAWCEEGGLSGYKVVEVKA